MFRRPLVFVAAAFVLGIVLRLFSVGNFLVFLFFCVLLATPVVLNILKVKLSAYEAFLFLLPFVFLLGAYRAGGDMRACEAEGAYGVRAAAHAEGTVCGIEGTEGRYTVYLQDVELGDKVRICGELVVYMDSLVGESAAGAETPVCIGNRLSVSGKISSFAHATNPGQFDQYDYYKAKGVCASFAANAVTIVDTHTDWFRQALFDLRERLWGVYEQALPLKQAGVLDAMLLGEKKNLDPAVKALYQDNGIAHILAISGLHLSLLGMGLYNLLRKLRRSLMFSASFAIVTVILYGIMTGFAVSAQRAIIMLCAALAAKMLGYAYDGLTALSFAAIVVLHSAPLMIMQASFLLSFAAVLGIILVVPAFSQLAEHVDNKVAKAALGTMCASVGITVATVPITAWFFFTMPLYSVLLNAVVLPLMGVLLVAAIAAGICGLVLLPLGVFCSGGVYFILLLYEWVCIVAQKLPFHTIVLGQPSLVNITIYYVLLATLLIIWRYKKYKSLIIIMLLSISVLVFKTQSNGLQITMLDVGQGDSIFIKDRSASYLVDAGSSSVAGVGQYRIRPFLLSRGISKIDRLFITHGDADHYNGAIELMEYGMVSHLVLTDITDKTEGYLLVERCAIDNHVPVSYFGMGNGLRHGSMQLDCLFPYPKMSGTDTNASSLILKLTYGEFSMLLTGDTCEEGESAAASYWKENCAGNTLDVFKSSHHASNYSNSETLLEAIRPEYVIISCALQNSYGHPGKEALARMQAVGSEVFCTMSGGAIMISTNGTDDSTRIKSYR